METKIITCLVADDDKNSRDLLRKHIEKVPFLVLHKECKNAFEALSSIQELAPDLIFLDIQMPGMNGFEMLSILSSAKPLVVAVSGDSSFAVEGFDKEILDFLLKPIVFERFAKAVLKAKNTLDRAGTVSLQLDPSLSESLSKLSVKESVDDYLLVKDGKRFVRIDVKGIQYVEAMKDYLKIHSQAGSTIFHETMSKMETKLPSPPFIRVHRSFIINKGIISEFEGNEIKTISGKLIPIGSTYRDGMLDFLGKHIV